MKFLQQKLPNLLNNDFCLSFSCNVIVSNVGIAELHAVKLGLTKDGMPCHKQKTMKPSAKVLTTTTQCKTLAKA